MTTITRKPTGRKWKDTTVKFLYYMKRRRMFEGAHDSVKTYTINTKVTTINKQIKKQKKRGIANKPIKKIK